MLGVLLEPGSKASLETKKLFAAALGALTAFLTTALVTTADSTADSWIGQPTRTAFQAALQGRLQAGTDPANAAFDDQWRGRGWASMEDREERAKTIAAGLT